MAKEYFSDLNYTLSNEDTRVEYQLLKQGAENVFSISGSGARCLPLIAKNPKSIDIVDMSIYQTYLFELRYQASKVLTYEEWLFFMGYRGGMQGGLDEGDDRSALFNRIDLRSETKAYWSERQEGWKKNGFILLGRWESHFQKLGKIFRDYLQCDFSAIFKAQNMNEQIRLYKENWPHIRWNSFMRVLASEYVFNKFLYKGHFSGKSEHRTEERPPYQFIIEEFERVFKTQLVRKNYFMQILFLGEIRYEEGLPLEAHKSVYESYRSSNTKIHYKVGNLLDFLAEKPYNFISLSDTISYLLQEDANQVLQKLHPETPRGSQMVIRSFMRAPTAIDSRGWIQRKDLENEAFKKDGTSVYQFHIFEKS